jgi:K+-sensing histidine kinase KdpD
MADAADATGGVERDDLARTISVVGLSISQAADELQHAAEQLSAAEERARDIDKRVAASEEQLGEQAARVAEMLSLLQRSRDGQIEAEERTRELEKTLERETERATRAEEQLETTDARARSLEERLEAIDGAEERARALEEQVRELEGQVRELEGQVRELEGQVLQAEEKPNVTVILDDERFAIQEAVAAEVRRPLTSILGVTLALKHADPTSPDGREMLRQLSANARKLDRLVGELLDIDRIAAGTFTPNLRRTDLEALVRRVADEAPDLANREVEIETDHVALEIDPGLTEQIVEALLANAGRRTVPGSPVWVRVIAAEGGAVIAVDDMGPEIPAGLRQAMFAAVRDEGSDGQRVRGTTGLSLLSRLVEIQGGRCWVEDRATEGASFRIFLPDAAQRPDQPSEAEGSPEEAPQTLEAEEEQDRELAV